MKRLAIKANPSKGKEIISFLESIGAKNAKQYCGDLEEKSYDGLTNHFFVGEDNIIYIGNLTENTFCPHYKIDNYHVYDIDVLTARYPYTLGDTILVDDCDGKFESVIVEMCWSFGEIYYVVADNNNPIYVDRIICKVQPTEKESISPINRTQSEINTYFKGYAVKTPNNMIEIEDYLSQHNLKLPNEIKINKTDGIVFNEFQQWCRAYPQSIEECYEIMGIDESDCNNCIGYNEDILSDLQDLMICRNAYWKVYGDWQPNYKCKINDTETETKYGIACFNGIVIGVSSIVESRFLIFPTIELRDEFMKTFNRLIDSCKYYI